MANLDQYIQSNRQRYVDELCEMLRIPSISSSRTHAPQVRRQADALATHMAKIGLRNARVMETGGHPVVYAEWLDAPGRPTVLIYGHYDVQPVDPLELWTSPPFEPMIRDGNLYARGAVDDKGQVFVHLKAIEAYLQTQGRLPLNVKIIVEGEEEIGSEHLEPFMAKHRDLLAADVVVVSDTPMYRKGLPSICYGLRGMCYTQIDLEGPSVDLHSGSLGGVTDNPLNVLSQIVAALKNRDGLVQIPGFYDKVRPLSPRERSMFGELPYDESEWLTTTGAPRLHGEKGFTTLERLWARPTLDCNGIWGGFSGEGSKTIIPARGGAKLSMRLVPDQEPEEIASLLERHLRAICPPTVRLKFTYLHGGRPFLADLDHPSFKAASRALERAFGAKAVYIREGGSIPFVRSIADVTGKPCLLLGFGLPDENSHAPNERLDLENYQKGIVSAAFLYEELGRA